MHKEGNFANSVWRQCFQFEGTSVTLEGRYFKKIKLNILLQGMKVTTHKSWNSIRRIIVCDQLGAWRGNFGQKNNKNMATHTVHTGAAFQNITRNYFFFFFPVRFEVNLLLLPITRISWPGRTGGCCCGDSPGGTSQREKNPFRH